VPVLSPGGRWECRWSLEVCDNATSVAGLIREMATLQAHGKATIHQTTVAKFSQE
jgi:hypothetical protein